MGGWMGGWGEREEKGARLDGWESGVRLEGPELDRWKEEGRERK